MTTSIKSLSFYRSLRGAAFAMIGTHRFYTPLSGARLSSAGQEGVRFEEIRASIRAVRSEGQFTIWQTELGEIATDSATELDHIAHLVREFRGASQYYSRGVHVRPADTVLDIGANIGLFAGMALRHKAGRIVCMEPTPNTFAALTRNLASAIESKKVVAIQKGAWNCEDTLRFHVNPGHPGNSSLISPQTVRDAYDLSISVEPIDGVLERLGIARVDFIKMDVEGAELTALEGAKHTLASRPRLAIGVEHTADRIQNAANVRDLVLKINPAYRCEPGPYAIIQGHQLAPEVLFFS